VTLDAIRVRRSDSDARGQGGPGEICALANPHHIKMRNAAVDQVSKLDAKRSPHAMRTVLQVFIRTPKIKHIASYLSAHPQQYI